MTERADAIRASLVASGYRCVIIAWSETEFIYEGYAIRLMQQQARLREAKALHQELDARFGAVSRFFPHLVALWEALAEQIQGFPRSVWDDLASEPTRSDFDDFSTTLGQFFRPLHREVTRLTGMSAQEVCSRSEMGLVTYQFLRRALAEPEALPDIGDWYEALRNGAGFAFLWNGVAVVLLLPEFSIDAQTRFHREDGPAVRWPGIGGDEHYYWHGVRVPEKVILRPELITRTEISAERNSEVSRVIAERMGWDRYLEVAGTILIDAWFDPVAGGRYELYDFKNRQGTRMPRLLKMQSPELQDGTRPFYIEPVPPQIRSCQAARKWQFRRLDGRWPSNDECNENPVLEFEVET